MESANREQTVGTDPHHPQGRRTTMRAVIAGSTVIRSTDGKWRHKAETVNSPRRKDAERILSERLREVNRGVRLPVETSFSDFVSSQWETYISQNLKPSTQASHRSNVRTHLLPSFGNLLPWPLAEAYAELFLRPTALLPKSRLRSMEHVEEHRHAEGSECIDEP